MLPIRPVTLAIALVWVGALFPVAIHLEGSASLTGWNLLVMGWRGVSAGFWAWLANPLFLVAVALLLVHRAQAAGVLAGFAIVLGLTSLAAEPMAARAGFSIPALSFGTGFHIWMGSLIALGLWAWVAAYLQITQK